MFNLKLTGKTFQGEARVEGDDGRMAFVKVLAEQPWSAAELRKLASLLQAAATLMEE